MKNTAPAFTLIELLVVIAIIAVLASLASAGAGAMIGKGHATKCLSNLRQIGAAMQMFTADHDGHLPGTSHGVSWTNSLGTYLGTNFIGKCPAVRIHNTLSFFIQLYYVCRTLDLVHPGRRCNNKLNRTVLIFPFLVERLLVTCKAKAVY
jgi:prepilin-type N-terminal cleavage/methylation domain-containing protein